jgi:FkbM family methyltransferase
MREQLDLFTLFSGHVQILRAAEIGVLSYGSSTLIGFINAGVNCDLYEAVPDFCDSIERDIAQSPNARLVRGAVSDYNGTMMLCMAGPSTFSASLESTPAINHDGFRKDGEGVKKLEVECRDFADLDPGDYDLVTMDIEGGEFPVLSRMRSRPRVLAIETQSRDYVNPQLGAITDWLVRESYKVWFRNDTDTVFVRGERPTLGLAEDIKAWWHNQRYFAGRL